MTKPAYNWGERCLHHLALGAPWLAEALLDADTRVTPSADPNQIWLRRHVFVSGLARGGTTILMRLIHQTGLYGSLAYQDMPFVTAPNLWAKVRRLSPRQITPTERAHRDGIMVDAESPEALDEVFWRIYAQHLYLHASHLAAAPMPEDVIKAFRQYVANILVSTERGAYLSKNNNNIIRLPAIRRAFPNALLLVPFRAPHGHANSLLRQHRAWLTQHEQDPFSLTYMQYLAHHEFGADQRPFLTPDTEHPDTRLHIDYWLRQWIRVYRHLLDQAETLAITPVSYESLCARPEAFWHGFTQRAGLPPGTPLPTVALHAAADSSLPGANPALLEQANALYESLQHLSIIRLSVKPGLQRAPVASVR